MRAEHHMRMYLLCAVLISPVLMRGVQAADGPAHRAFRFTYAASVVGLELGQSARIWVPIAFSSSDQQVAVEQQDIPAPMQIGREAQHGNEIGYFQATAGLDGSVRFSIVYDVTRHEIGEEKSASAVETDQQFLQPDKLVPVGGKPMTLLVNRTLPSNQLELGRLLYDVVGQHMEYRKDKPGWGRGDAVWACDSGFGNCTDFHSLFISLARSEHIPALFEIGFLIPDQRGSGDVAGYHCWARFKPAGHEWVPVDISEADKNPSLRDYYFGHLTENRVQFSSGRDLELVPRQAGPPVNFLIYPYVEVGGRVYPAEKIQCHFSYQDIPDGKP